MKFNSIDILVVIFGAALLLAEGCASSTYNQRYNVKNKQEETKESVNIAVEDSIDFSELFDDESEFDDSPPTTAEKDIPRILQRYYTDNNQSASPAVTSIREKVIMEIIKYLDTPYKYGGNSEKGIDCSAFTQTVFTNVFAYNLPRTARDQYALGADIDREDLHFGDLVFFNTRRRVRPGHVGIYIGDNLFAHASRKLGVTVSSLDEDYYSNRFMGGRRMEEMDFKN